MFGLMIYPGATLAHYANLSNTVSLSFTRIAKHNNLPLDLMLVRKIGIPMHEETAMGAMWVVRSFHSPRSVFFLFPGAQACMSSDSAMHDVVYLNEEFIRRLQVPKQAVQQVIDREVRMPGFHFWPRKH